MTFVANKKISIKDSYEIVKTIRYRLRIYIRVLRTLLGCDTFCVTSHSHVAKPCDTL